MREKTRQRILAQAFACGAVDMHGKRDVQVYVPRAVRDKLKSYVHLRADKAWELGARDFALPIYNERVHGVETFKPINWNGLVAKWPQHYWDETPTNP